MEAQKREIGARHVIVLAVALGLAFGLTEQSGRVALGFALATTLFLYIWQAALGHIWQPDTARWGCKACLARLAFSVGLLGVAGLYGWLSLWMLRPDLLPRRVYYDLIANRRVTERLVDPALFKVERWEILGQERQVLFVHPSAAGSATLVYPVRIEPRTMFRADMALAPEAWQAEGDGVTFSVYVEDDAGIHLLYSRYLDPKHHQQDMRWTPVRINLDRFAGKLVRLILTTGAGPAGDSRYDWAGWGAPRLEQPVWP